ncbi:YicC/YloC family endoribonuclease [Coralliovum pocilloporae]|uniref:YicC/YloC family endoribonuclease n=1 Tax=Coralliovum pocilloporae TaxID=3066369 RepID=UPI003306D8FC
MTLASMTGFATAEGESGSAQWAWELKTVNGKGLDIRLRLPSGFEALEAAAKKDIASVLRRGTGYATLSVHRVDESDQPTINEAVLIDLAHQAKALAEKCGLAAPTIEGLLAIRGTIDVREKRDQSPDDMDSLQRDILSGLSGALAELKEMRQREGAETASVLLDRLSEIEDLVARAEASPARTPDAIRKKLSEQVEKLLESASALDSERLHQEAVILATKADIREELDRLTAHIQAARDLLASGEAVGRRLDFLAQEFNREANTLCSKSNDSGLTAIGLDLKATIDQLREQIQNIE